MDSVVYMNFKHYDLACQYQKYMKLSSIAFTFKKIFEESSFIVNTLNPEFLKWTLPSLNWDMSTDANWGYSLKSKPERETV